MPEHETCQSDISGLKVRIPNISTQQINRLEAENISRAVGKYLFPPKKKNMDFDIPFFLKLHKEMLGNVWSWAGQIRTVDLNIGSRAVVVQQDMIILQYDLAAMDIDFTTAVVLHHRAVKIHPFKNGNGRWSRLLSNIFLYQNNIPIVDWPVSINRESEIRQEYVAALRQADALDYSNLLRLHQEYQAKI